MPEFIVREISQIGGEIRREAAILTMSKNDVKREMALGKHAKSGKWMSAILNHCEPNDDDTYELIFGKPPDEEEPEEEKQIKEAARIDAIRAEMDDLGVSWDRRWQLKRLETELIIARKLKGA